MLNVVWQFFSKAIGSSVDNDVCFRDYADIPKMRLNDISWNKVWPCASSIHAQQGAGV